ncbi:hypothetical protein ACFQL1_12535 [Halomicroarcula sp. GCM10025709]
MAGDYDTVRQAVLTEGLPAPSERVPRLPDAVDSIVEKATARRKLGRYETAAGVRRDCWRLLRSFSDEES